jgi:two-component system response regulator HydG
MSSGNARILVVDDHPQMGRLLSEALGEAGHDVRCARGGREAIELVSAELPDLVLTDLRMEQVDGFDVLKAVQELDAAVPVVVMTAFGGIETAIEAIKRGAYHYLVKPFSMAEVLLLVERALKESTLRSENALLRRATRAPGGPDGLVGSSACMRELRSLLEQLDGSSAPVLITGESGTGKELVSRALHDRSLRRDKPFVAVNCTTLPEALLESELFGHVRGAFSGATVSRRGLFVEADGGTLFLDEIGDMPPPLQAKMLRVIQDGELRPVGSDTVRRVDVRIIAATNQDLERRVAEGQFRRDLFFRLNVLAIRVPPLRERPEDLPALVEHFVARARARNPAARALRFGPAVLEALAQHGWPGNVRELENLVERLVLLSRGEEIGTEDLDRWAPFGGGERSPLEVAQERLVPLRELENAYISWVIARCGGSKTKAAEVLGIDVSTIYRRDRDRGTGA